MGKRRYNAKARQVVKTNIDNAQTNEIKLDFGTNEYGSSDTTNLLALPSKKRETKVIKDKKEKTRILSKVQRKKLEKIVEKKKKKENRAALLESLSKVQATSDEVKHLVTISSIQTIGLRKLTNTNLKSVAQNETNNSRPSHISSIKGAYKRRKLLTMVNQENNKKRKYDPSVVGLEESSSYESSSEDEIEKNGPEIVENEQDKGEEENGAIKVDNSDDESKIENDEPKVEKDKEKEENGLVKVHNLDCENKMENNELKCNSRKDIEKHSKPNKNNKLDKPITEINTVITNSENNNPKKLIKISWDPTKKSDKKLVKDEPKDALITSNHVTVNRDPKVQVARLKLPILAEEQRIMELIHENDILIVAGETGSGKTTQLPQFLYEAGYAKSKMIAVTEPRRVATVAMSSRVAHELALTSREVSYLMRFEGNVTKDTKIKFMTDGVLLKEMRTDTPLNKYSVVIIDEAHERSIYTDILLGMLSRVVLMRRKRGDPLKLIIMSATLRVDDFTGNTRLFKIPPPVINVEGRQFPVTIHFNKVTYHDYLKEAYRKTVKIHTRLPEGGILIFVSGQQEVNYLVKKLMSAFPYRKNVDYSKIITKTKPRNEVDTALDSEPEDIESDDDEVEKEMKRALKARKKSKLKARTLPKINLDDYDMPDDDGQADLVGSDDEIEGCLSDSDGENDPLMPEIKSCRQPLWVLPLYSMLSSSKQAKVFAQPPVGARLCVVSTDVAETSLTIPSIKYVVDAGKKKMRLYDHNTGVSSYRVVWTSQASAGQRAGRAGRTGPGHAYRLYSAAVFQHDCPPHHPPDILRRPIDDLVLNMMCMGIHRIANFPFPTAPDRLQLHLAEKRLEVLGLLEKFSTHNNKKHKGEELLKVTELGEVVSMYPVLPRYGKMLALSHQKDLLPYAIAMVSSLTVPEVLSGKSDSWPATGHMQLLGDPGVLLRAIISSEHAHFKGEDDEVFCAKYGLREKAIKEIRKLRKQLSSEINLVIEGADAIMDPELKPPDDNQAKFLRQLLVSGLGDQVGKKIGLHEVKEGEDKRKFKYAYHCGDLDEPVHLHSESILRKVIPEWVIYQELYETGSEDKRKMIMRNITAIEPEWLPLYVPQLCNLSEPLLNPGPRFDEQSGKVKCHVTGTFGKAGWELPTTEIIFPETIDKYRWFGKFLLEGSVFPKLRKFTSSLLSPPSTMIKSWAKLHERTDILLKALIAKRAGTRDALKNVWEKEPKYLLNEYQKWLPVSAHNDAALYWPPLDK